MNRRRFIVRGLQSSAVASFPAILSGCGVAPFDASREEAPQLLDSPFALSTAELEAALSTLGARGADFGEAFVQERRAREIHVEDDAVVHRDEAGLRGAGLRVVRGQTQGFAATEEVSGAGLLAAATAASASMSEDEPFVAQSLTPHTRPSRYPIAESWEGVRESRPVALLRRVAAQVRAADPTVTTTRGVWHGADETVLIATLDGRFVVDNRPMTRMSVEVTATRDGRSHTAFASVAGRAGLEWYTDAKLTELAKRAGDRVEALFAARQPPLGQMSVVLAAGAGGAVLHEAVARAFEADFSGGRSPFADALNRRIADSAVTLIDDPRVQHERGALNFDDEAQACERTVLVENGVARGLLHDRRTAQRFSTTSTGSARRASYRHTPTPRTTCTIFENGGHDPEELVTAMGRGIIAESIVGGLIDTSTGDYRFHVKHGWLVEKGRRLVPVRDFDLIGNPMDILGNVQLVGNDLAMDPAGWSSRKEGQAVPVSHGMPSVLVSRLGVESRG